MIDFFFLFLFFNYILSILPVNLSFLSFPPPQRDVISKSCGSFKAGGLRVPSWVRVARI